MWKYRRYSMIWLDHAPPILLEYKSNLKLNLNLNDSNNFNNFNNNENNGRWESLTGYDKCYTHEETAYYGLVFTHYAYVLKRQVNFKENFYGYKNALKKWLNLHKNIQDNIIKLPIINNLNKYLSWININKPTSANILPISHMASINDENGENKQQKMRPLLSSLKLHNNNNKNNNKNNFKWWWSDYSQHIINNIPKSIPLVLEYGGLSINELKNMNHSDMLYEKK